LVSAAVGRSAVIFPRTFANTRKEARCLLQIA
jgi:hypothetical protein